MRSTIRGKFVRLKHLNRSGTWPSGNPRYYYRRPGHKAVPMPDAPIDSLTFREAHSAAERATGAPQPLNHGTGSIGAAIVAYAASDVFLSLSASTRDQRKRIMDKLRAAYGQAALKDLRPRHIRQDLAKLPAHPANNRLKVWRALGKWWVDAGLLDDDPAFPVRKRATPVSDGFEAWTREDVAAFRAHWPHDTAQRMAILGHETATEAARYSKSADLRRVITGTESSNSLPTFTGKGNKYSDLRTVKN